MKGPPYTIRRENNSWSKANSLKGGWHDVCAIVRDYEKANKGRKKEELEKKREGKEPRRGERTLNRKQSLPKEKY